MKSRLLAATAGLALVLTACGSSGSEPTASPAASSDSGSEPAAPTSDTAMSSSDETASSDSAAGTAASATGGSDFASMSWDDVVAQAKEEGEVVWFNWYLQPEFREFTEAFTEEYGIKVTVADGELDANMSKLEAEAGRDTGDIDVLSTGFDKIANLDPTALFQPIDFLPEAESLPMSFGGVDTQGTGVAWWGNQTGLAYDSTQLSEADLPQTMDEMMAFVDANPDKFAINDPSGGGAGPSFVQSVIRSVTGSDDYNDTELDQAKVDSWAPAFELLQSKPIVYTASNADSLTRLNDGEFLMVPAWEDHLAGLQKDGAISSDIKFYIPDFKMNGGANDMSVPINAPHPAAALVFVNWISSAETQTALNERFGSAPMRPDADDSFALVPAEQRANSTTGFSAPYSAELAKLMTEELVR